MRFVCHIVGAPATGKTWLRGLLAEAVPLASYGIDDERLRLVGAGKAWPADDGEAWARLQASVMAAEACIVETSGHSRRDRALLDGAGVFRILCDADQDVRRARLVARQETGYPLAGDAEYVERLLQSGAPDLPKHLLVDTSRPVPAASVGALVAAVRRVGHAVVSS